MQILCKREGTAEVQVPSWMHHATYATLSAHWREARKFTDFCGRRLFEEEATLTSWWGFRRRHTEPGLVWMISAARDRLVCGPYIGISTCNCAGEANHRARLPDCEIIMFGLFARVKLADSNCMPIVHDREAAGSWCVLIQTFPTVNQLYFANGNPLVLL